MNKKLAQRIFEERSKKKLTQKELGNLLGVTDAAIGMWENDKRTPDPPTLERLADIFDVTVDYLLCRPMLIKEPPSKYHTDNKGNVHDLEEILKHAKLINIDGKKYTKDQLLNLIRIGVVTSDAVDKIKWPEKN